LGFCGGEVAGVSARLISFEGRTEASFRRENGKCYSTVQ